MGGVIIMLIGETVYYQIQLQFMVALSSMEAKFVNMAIDSEGKFDKLSVINWLLAEYFGAGANLYQFNCVFDAFLDSNNEKHLFYYYYLLSIILYLTIVADFNDEKHLFYHI